MSECKHESISCATDYNYYCDKCGENILIVFADLQLRLAKAEEEKKKAIEFSNYKMKENNKLYEHYSREINKNKELESSIAELVITMKHIITISDRRHDAWDKAKEVLKNGR